MTDAYRTAINAVLAPHDIMLVGDDFFGPYDSRAYAREVICTALDAIDLGILVERLEADAQS